MAKLVPAVRASNGVAVWLLVTAVSAALLAGTATAQTIEYTITDIPMAPGAFNTVPLALNDDGVVVGWAQFSGGGFYLRGWRWSADEGMTLLPPPPGEMSDRYAAVDINNLGVIAGDGGYYSGQAWRFESDTYTIIGSLPGLAGSRSPAINVVSTVVATAFDPQSFLVPTRAFVFTDQNGIEDLFPAFSGSAAADINDAGQIVARASNTTIRLEVDGSFTFLPIPEGFAGAGPAAINAIGDIAGTAACSHECNQAFLWTDVNGHQIIPYLGTRHTVGGVNNRREVVGGVSEGVARGWVWSADRGLRVLAGMVDPALTRNIYDAQDINNNGQIITYGGDYSDALDPYRIMLLTPINPVTPGDMDDDEDVDLGDYDAFYACMTGPWGGVAIGCEGANLEPDGDVDVKDFAEFTLIFTGTR